MDWDNALLMERNCQMALKTQNTRTSLVILASGFVLFLMGASATVLPCFVEGVMADRAYLALSSTMTLNGLCVVLLGIVLHNQAKIISHLAGEHDNHN